MRTAGDGDRIDLGDGYHEREGVGRGMPLSRPFSGTGEEFFGDVGTDRLRYPFHQKPTSLLFDYKVKLSGDPNRIKLSGFSKRSEVNGIDMPLVNLFLQKRWEDKDGNIYAKRIGTLVIRMDKNTDWVNDANFTILYGDITKRSDYKEYMGFQLGESARYSLNSKGKNVPVQEIGWGTEDDEVTHMILEFCSSHGGSYIGSPGNTFWVDNIRLGY